jgi:two-component system NtrC family response regulator
MVEERIAPVEPFQRPLLIGQSPEFLMLKGRLPTIARAQRTTLIGGPTGSGKDLVARSLHEQSVRASRPYVAVHCAALPESLVEAEMFGHSRGAFTGATQNRPGLIRSASDGTLFLDEIDSLPAVAQAKLLRFLETGEYRAVGSDRVEHSDAWVIAATNQDLGERVRQGAFRADLMYRLEVMRLDVPPLKERKGDILCLADHFLDRISDGTKHFAEEARRALISYDWPGNVRELRHRVESASLLSSSVTIDVGALSLTGARAAPSIGKTAGPPPASLAAADGGPKAPTLERELWALISDQGLSLSDAVAQCERIMVQAALRAEGNNRTRAASRLGIHVRTIFKKLTD